ncbi:MAG: hypothetical protein NT178_06595 [Proteobacteria bacterium]|nr:hypothetical protein [Pseudomonadota bacterium]
MEIYCTQLGMVIDITYCISVNDGLPCRNTIGCWENRIDIHVFLKENFTPNDLKKAFSNLPKSKIERIIESAHIKGSVT